MGKFHISLPKMGSQSQIPSNQGQLSSSLLLTFSCRMAENELKFNDTMHKGWKIKPFTKELDIL